MSTQEQRDKEAKADKEATERKTILGAALADEHDDVDELGKKEFQRSVFTWLPVEAGMKPHSVVSGKNLSNYGVPFKHMEEYLKGEVQEAEACRSLPFTLLLVISYSIMAVAHDDAITVRAVEQSLEQDVRGNANFAFTGDFKAWKGLDDIHAVDDIYEWMKDGLIPLVMQQEKGFHEGYNENDPQYQAAAETIPPEERGFWLNYNRIVGGIRMVQEVSEETECTSLEELRPVYGMKCVGGHDYDLDPEVGLPAERAITTIEPTRERWLWVIDDLANVTAQIDTLVAENWINRETKKVEIGIATYNAEFGVHTLIRINFYFSRGGYIWKKIYPMSQFADWHDRWYYGFYDGVWGLCIIFIFMMEVNTVQALIRNKGGMSIFKEYISFYNAVDWMTVLGGFGIIVLFSTSITMRTEMNTLLEIVAGTNIDTGRESYQNTAKQYYDSLLKNVSYVRNLRLALAVYPLIIVFRLFKSFSAQPRLGMVTNTMMRAGPDLFHFFIVFVSVFITFTICGIVLFGREVRSFTTVSRAMVTCFRIMLGDIDWEELSAIGRLPAGVWLWMFVIVVVLLMLNMVLAIIMDNYEVVKEEAGSGETLWAEAYQLYSRWKDTDHVPLEHVLEACSNENRRQTLAVQGPDTLQKSLLGFVGAIQEVADEVNLEMNQVAEDMKANVGFGAGADPQQSPRGDAPNDGPAEKAKNTSLLTQEEKVHQHGIDDFMLIVTPTLIVEALKKHTKFSAKPTASEEAALLKQARDIIIEACGDFYDKNKKRAELEELMQLTLKVSSRVTKLTKLTRRAHMIRDEDPVKELKWFEVELEKYITDVKRERKENVAERDLLRHQYYLIKEKLLHFKPESVFPKRPIGIEAKFGDGEAAAEREEVLEDDIGELPAITASVSI